jgi:hypothetical protein
MIVRDEGSTLCLITQPDHAGLAAVLMEHWRGEEFASRPTRLAAIAATRDHDIGWTDFDAAPVIDTGTRGPADFVNAPASLRQRVWRRALEILPARSTYVAALVAQHALTVYRRFRTDRDWDTFFGDMERARDRWFTTDVRPDGSRGGALDPPLPLRRTFLQDYAIVATGDLLSLTFCAGWTARQHAEGYEIQLTGRELHVMPDPFQGARIPFSVEARRIANRPFRTDDDLRRAVRDAEVVTLEGLALGFDGQSG